MESALYPLWMSDMNTPTHEWQKELVNKAAFEICFLGYIILLILIFCVYYFPVWLLTIHKSVLRRDDYIHHNLGAKSYGYLRYN
jgi:hypothetical protein